MLVIMAGYVAACCVVSVVPAFLLLAAFASQNASHHPVSLVGLFMIALLCVVAATLLPSLFAIIYAERTRSRSALSNGIGGAVVGVLTAVLLTLYSTEGFGYVVLYGAISGFLGGLVYWLIAGRKAGSWLGNVPSMKQARKGDAC
jgi:hypothetical protein